MPIYIPHYNPFRLEVEKGLRLPSHTIPNLSSNIQNVKY